MKKIRKTHQWAQYLPNSRKHANPIYRLVNTIPLGLHQYQLQPNGELVYRGGNPAGDRILGIDHHALIGKTIEAAFPNLALTEIPDAYRQTARNGGGFERELVTYQDQKTEGIFKIQAFQTGPDRMAVLFEDISDKKQIERSLAESEERYRSLVELSPEAIIVHSDGKLVYINPVGLHQIGAERLDQVVGMPVMDLLPPETRQLNLEIMEQVAQGKSVPALEQTILRPDGIEVDVEIVGAPVLFEGKPAFQLIVRDITERKRAAKALRESEDRFRRLFEDTSLGVFQSSPEGKALAVNPSFASMFGYKSPEEVVDSVQNVARDIFADPNRRAEISQMVRENPEQKTFENIYRRKDGSTFPGTLHLHPVKDAADRLLYFEGLIEDISERKRAEVQIHDLAKFPEENPNPVARISREGVLLFANPAAVSLLATYNLEIGKPIPSDWQDYLSQVLGDGQFKELEIQQDGRIFSFQLTPFLEENYVNIYGLDVTKRKEAEASFHESERQTRSLIDAAPLGLHQFTLLPDGRLIFTGANPAADHILGIDHRILIDLPIEDAFPTHRYTDIPAIYRKVAQEGTPYSSEQISYEDDKIHGVFEIYAFQTSPSRMAVFFQDITEKKKAAMALEESEEKYRTLIEKNSEGVVLYDEQGLTVEWNTAQEHISGISRPDALGRPAWDLQFQLLPSEKKVPARYEEMKERGSRILQSDQSPIFYHPVEATIHRPDGTLVIIQQTAFPIKTRSGFRVGSIMRDITDRKQAELDIKRRMIELEALHAVALAGTEAMTIDDLLVQVGGVIREKLYPDHFGVAFLDKEAQSLSYHPSFSQDTCLAAVQVPLECGISGAVVRTGFPRRVADVRLDPDYLEANADTRSELCVPIIIGGRVIGVVNLENAKPGSFSEADERLVSAIAGELGISIEKIRILEEERNRRKELEALEQISGVLRTEEDKVKVLNTVLKQVMTALNLDGAGLGFIDPQSGELVTELGMGKWVLEKGNHIPLGEGISGQVAASQHYYLNNNITLEEQIEFHDPNLRLKCFLCLALIVDSQTQGLLYFGRNTAFLPKDVHLAIAMADTLAGALHRIELHKQTQHQLERLMALRAIDQSILSHLELKQTLDVLLEKITRLLQVDAANFLLYQSKTQKLMLAAEHGLSSAPIWNSTQELRDTHAGKVALNRKIEFIADLSQIEDSLTKKLSEIGEDFASYAAVPLIAKGELKGVLQVFNHSRLLPSSDWMGFLEALADQAAIAINSAQLFDEQQQTNARLTKAYEDTIDGWSRALDLRDRETEGHSQRVTDLTLELAHGMGIPEDQMAHIRRGAKLHDIGKMGIPDNILLKPDKLSEDEWKIMRQHPTFAADLLYPIEFLGQALEIPFSHHEKWDGTGYPQGLKGQEIPLAPRIFAVIDVWDALTHNRPYRPAWTNKDALNYIREQSGKHFDPRVVEEFLALQANGSFHAFNDKVDRTSE